MNKIDQKIAGAIRSAYPMPDNIKRLAGLAAWDLNYGPITFCETCGVDNLSECKCETPWAGFEEATRELAQWFDKEIPSTLYYTEDCDFISEFEPQGEEENGTYFEPMPYYALGRKEIKQALFSELAEYI